MKCSGNSEWRADLGFIRSGRAEILHPFSRVRENLSWSIQTLPAGLLPISVVECRLAGMGQQVFGYGDSVFFKNSLIQAFAEAWERLWFTEFRKSKPGDMPPTSSNGFASGRTSAEAEARARGELIERSVFLTAWRVREGWSRIPIDGFLNQVLSAAIAGRGWHLSLFRLSEARLGDVICGLGTRDRGGILFDCHYQGTGATSKQAQSKVLKSLLRTALILDRKEVPFAPLPQRGGPDAHSDFYRDPGNAEAFAFLSGPQPPRTLQLGRYERTSSRVIVALDRFPYVAMATNPAWPALKWGKESLVGSDNPWPHPLA